MAVQADQNEAPRIVPTAITQRNTSDMSTIGRFGEKSNTLTAKKGGKDRADSAEQYVVRARS